MLPLQLMRILIFHGYPLRGTGSNVFNAELARALREAGHHVHLLCQEPAPQELEFVDAIGTWSAGELTVAALERGDARPEHGGSCVVYCPPIGEVLPVYVADRYDGFDAKTFSELSETELGAYLERNVAAVRDVAELCAPEAALANHMVAGPVVLARALGDAIPYAVKIHGSAMEYTVRADSRFLPYAIEGLAAAKSMLVGSRHIADRARQTLELEGLDQRTFIATPGVELRSFRPKPRQQAREGLREVAGRLDAAPRGGFDANAAEALTGLFERIQTASRTEGTLSYSDAARAIEDIQGGYDTSGVDADAANALRSLMQLGDAPVALFVGKLIVSKGVDLLLAAWPLVLQRHPEARLVITGFGAYREALNLMLEALSNGDLPTAKWLAGGGRALEGGPADQLELLQKFFTSQDDHEQEQYLSAAQGMRESITWTGRLDHSELSGLIPIADCQVVPSTFPEAFGMVAAEAAACGVAPISADHSGLAEVTEQLQENLSGVSGGLLSFSVDDQAVERLANRINGVFGLGVDQRRELSARLVSVAEDRFSWQRTAENVLAAASGDFARLRRP